MAECLQNYEAEEVQIGNPENNNKEKQEQTGFTSLVKQSLNQEALSGSHFLGFNCVKMTTELSRGAAASPTIIFDSGQVQHKHSNSTLNFPDVSKRPGMEMCGDRRKGRLPQLWRTSDKEDCSGTRSPDSDANRHMLPDEGVRVVSPTRGEKLDLGFVLAIHG